MDEHQNTILQPLWFRPLRADRRTWDTSIELGSILSSLEHMDKVLYRGDAIRHFPRQEFELRKSVQNVYSTRHKIESLSGITADSSEYSPSERTESLSGTTLASSIGLSPYEAAYSSRSSYHHENQDRISPGRQDLLRGTFAETYEPLGFLVWMLQLSDEYTSPHIVGRKLEQIMSAAKITNSPVFMVTGLIFALNPKPHNDNSDARQPWAVSFTTLSKGASNGSFFCRPVGPTQLPGTILNMELEELLAGKFDLKPISINLSRKPTISAESYVQESCTECVMCGMVCHVMEGCKNCETIYGNMEKGRYLPFLFDLRNGPWPTNSALHPKVINEKRTALTIMPNNLSYFFDPITYKATREHIRNAVYGHAGDNPLGGQFFSGPLDLKGQNHLATQYDLEDGIEYAFGIDKSLFKRWEDQDSWSRMFIQLVRYHRSFISLSLHLIFLQQSRLIHENLTLLVLDEVNNGIAHLVSLSIKLIYKATMRYHKLVFTAMYTLGVWDNCLARINDYTDIILRSLRIQTASKPSSKTFPQHVATLDRCLTILHLAVFLHTRGHIFDSQNCRAGGISLVGDFSTRHGDLIRQAKLKCLSPVLGDRPVWVIHPNFAGLQERERDSSNVEALAPLSISTDIETFTGVWGPVWEVRSDEGVIQYNIANGCIVPSESSSSSEEQVRHCHWLPYNLIQEASRSSLTSDHVEISSRHSNHSNSDALSTESAESGLELSSESEEDTSDMVEVSSHPYLDSSDTIRRYIDYAHSHPLKPNDILLIGMDARLQRVKCDCSSKRRYDRYCARYLVHPIGTRRPDASIHRSGVQLSVGHQGVGVNVPFTVQRDHRDYKEFLCEKWNQFQQGCHPNDLLVHGGVMMSLCTKNAIRCTILGLFKLPTLINVLGYIRQSNLEAPLPDEDWDCLLDAERQNILELWQKSKNHSESLRKIFADCLHYLRCTGLDEERHSFGVLWAVKRDNMPDRVVFKPSAHSWMGCLKDYFNICTMAVVSDECFAISDQGIPLQRCVNNRKSRRPTRLETSLLINPEQPPFNNMRKSCRSTRPKEESASCRKLYNIYEIEVGTQIRIAEPCQRFEVIDRLGHNHLLVQPDISFRQLLWEAVFLTRYKQEGHTEVFRSEHGDSDVVLLHVEHNGLR